MSESTTYIVAGTKSWNRRVYQEVIQHYPGEWLFIDNKDELTTRRVTEHNPRYIFFLHWSWIVPEEIFQNYECVCFHMADVPYGRGGSPLQNLIVRGHRQTKLSALRMVEELDAGPVYLKEDLSLEGSAEEIYIRTTRLSARMIKELITHEPQPVPQSGEPIIFIRRKPAESEIPALDSAATLHDFIRMLDAEGYPCAFIEHKGFRYEFHQTALCDEQVKANVTITPIKEDA